MARLLNLHDAAPSQEDRQRWLLNRKARGQSVPKGLAPPPPSTQPVGLLGQLSLVLGSPVEVLLPRSGAVVRVDEPTVASLKGLLATCARIQGQEVEAMIREMGPGAQALLISSTEIRKGDGSWGPVSTEWFNSLRGSDGITLIEAFLSAFDIKALQDRISSIRGKVMGEEAKRARGAA